MMKGRSTIPLMPITYGIGIMSMLLFSSCFAPKSSSPLEEDSLPKETVALIPITPNQVRMVLRTPESVDAQKAIAGENIIKDREEVAEVVNKSLNSLASGSSTTIVGPDRLAAMLKDAALLENVYVYLNDPGDINEQWKLAGLSGIFKSVDMQNLVKITVTVDAIPVTHSGGGGAAGVSWEGVVFVRAQLLSVASVRIISTAYGDENFWGAAGAIGGPMAAVPFGLGKTFGQAVDQALRKALSALFREPPGERP